MAKRFEPDSILSSPSIDSDKMPKNSLETPAGPCESECPSQRPLRVLLYTTCYNVIDGVTLTVRKIEDEILSSGGSVCILTTKSGDMKNTHMNGTHPNRRVIFLDNSVEIPFLKDPKNSALSYHFGTSLSKTVEAEMDKFKPTIVHLTVSDVTGLYVIEYARSRELPLMGTYHSNIPDYMDHYPGLRWLKPFLSALFRHGYVFLQALYVPTPYVRKMLVEQHQLDRITSLQVWGRGVDLKKFSPSHRSLIFRQKLGISDDCPVILYVGRLVPEKRPDIFARVIRRLKSENVPFHAVIVGAGPSEDEVKNLPNTTHMGWLSGSRLGEVYASSDVFLFPSAVETFGNVTLEAAASGLPLVVEANCSEHLVPNKSNGFACSADDEEEFFQGTRKLVIDHDLRTSCSQQSVILSQSMELHVVSKQMLDNYRAVTKQFYHEFQGLHHNRDKIYQKAHSFRSGTDPRPFGLGILGALFVKMFQVAAFAISLYNWCRDIRRLTNVFVKNDAVSLAQSTGGCASNASYDAIPKLAQYVTGEVDRDIKIVGADSELFNMEEGVMKSVQVNSDDQVAFASEAKSKRSCGASVGDSHCAMSTSRGCVALIYCSWRMSSKLSQLLRNRRPTIIEHHIDALSRKQKSRSLFRRRSSCTVEFESESLTTVSIIQRDEVGRRRMKRSTC